MNEQQLKLVMEILHQASLDKRVKYTEISNNFFSITATDGQTLEFDKEKIQAMLVEKNISFSNKIKKKLSQSLGVDCYDDEKAFTKEDKFEIIKVLNIYNNDYSTFIKKIEFLDAFSFKVTEYDNDFCFFTKKSKNSLTWLENFVETMDRHFLSFQILQKCNLDETKRKQIARFMFTINDKIKGYLITDKHLEITTQDHKVKKLLLHTINSKNIDAIRKEIRKLID